MDCRMKTRRRGTAKKTKAAAGPGACCRIEALVTLDAKGQILLPKEVRERAGLRAGDKLAVITCESDDKIFRVTLVKAEQFTEIAREMLGPMMEMLRE